MEETTQQPLPDDLIARVENAKNKITIMTAEYERLLKLSSELTIKINKQHIEDKDNSEKIAALEIKKEDLIKEVEDASLKLVEVKKATTDEEEKLDTLKTEIEQFIATKAAQTSDLDERQKKITKIEEDMERRLQVLAERETEHLSKVEQLKKAIQTIWQV